MGSLRLLPLGGLGEIGMNCLALEQNGEVLLIDCGVTFDARGFGVDVVHPSFDALEPYRVVGLFVTHGHEDHIGAIPYLLRRFDVPVYGPGYALRLLRERAGEHEILDHVALHEVKPRNRVRVASFEVEPIRVTHSIADATALAIRTDAGLVVHTGDFKFDESPPDGEMFDVVRFEELAREGVRLLFSDSTNIDASGQAGSEEGVADALDSIVSRAEQAVIVGVFASNVHRLRMLGEIAQRSGRKLVALGRSVSTHAKVARATARSTGEHSGAPYLDWPSDLVWPAERARELPRRRVLGIATGTQGEERAALSRLARGEHPLLDVVSGDTVVMSSRVIPGNERDVMSVMGDLLRRGVELRTWWSDRAVHVSGHAHRQEQRRMIEMVRPQAFVPVHGTLHHLRRHADLARELGVPHVCVLENGDIGQVDSAEVADRSSAGAVRRIGRAPVGRVHVFARRRLSPSVLQERAILAANGTAHLTIRLDARGMREGDVALATRGVVDETREADVLTTARSEAGAAIDELLGRASSGAVDSSAVAEAGRAAVRRALGRLLGFKPLTTALVVHVSP
ncbi:MAG: ribonuclease J [Myxococcota bacterium]|nr:ribonuclease J [Myxococcota bacterium]